MTALTKADGRQMVRSLWEDWRTMVDEEAERIGVHALMAVSMASAIKDPEGAKAIIEIFRMGERQGVLRGPLFEKVMEAIRAVDEGLEA